MSAYMELPGQSSNHIFRNSMCSCPNRWMLGHCGDWGSLPVLLPLPTSGVFGPPRGLQSVISCGFALKKPIYSLIFNNIVSVTHQGARHFTQSEKMDPCPKRLTN